MNTKAFLWSMLLLLSTVLVACNDDDNSNTKSFKVTNITNSGCKANAAKSDDANVNSQNNTIESIVCEAAGENAMRVTHNNAVLNCEPGTINIDAKREGNIITVTESETTNLANCVCYYDLGCKIEPIEDGEFTVIIKHKDKEKTRFTISYNSSMKEEFVISEK